MRMLGCQRLRCVRPNEQPPSSNHPIKLIDELNREVRASQGNARFSSWLGLLCVELDM